MRLYTFGNYYMSSIQQGIQASHVVSELFVKYRDTGINHDYDYLPAINGIEYQIKVDNLYDWAENHKTMVCLNGGNLLGLEDILTLLKDVQNNLPWAVFYEDEMSLGGILTNVGIIIPEHIYDSAYKVRNSNHVISNNNLYGSMGEFVCSLNDFEIKLINLLNSCQLAK